MAEHKLKIGYAGSLKAHRPGDLKRPWHAPISDRIWTFRNRSVQHHTRSGYYLLKGVQAFHAAYPERVGELDVHLWGMIDGENARQVEEFGIGESVRIGGYVSKGESEEMLGECDVLFLPLETADDPLFIPGKVFDYIQLGKPVLALGPESDCTRILDRAGLGMRLDPEDTAGIAEMLYELLEGKAELAGKFQVDRKWVEGNFHFRNLTKKLDGIFENVTS